ncbi:transposase [Mesorhizobium sp. M0854]|uniref:transposase n=1 Tax=Mesorhizobium sp. M0854 TaxID=2957013 RepID=UPI00333C4299
MSMPGVGPVVSLAYTATIDPRPLPQLQGGRSEFGPDAGAPESGESRRVGGISLCGDGMMRPLLYEAARILLTRVTKWSGLKAWAMDVAKRRGQQKAIVALARRLAVIMHRIWSDGTQFRWTRTEITPVAG